jgi:hypothetical protein
MAETFFAGIKATLTNDLTNANGMIPVSSGDH